MTDIVRVHVQENGWISNANLAIERGDTVYVSLSSDLMLQVISKVHEQAVSNPFVGMVKAVGNIPNIPPIIPPLVDKTTAWVNAVAAIGGGAAGVLISVGMVMANAVAHNYEVEIGWALHKLLDANDDEAFIHLSRMN